MPDKHQMQSCFENLNQSIFTDRIKFPSLACPHPIKLALFLGTIINHPQDRIPMSSSGASPPPPYPMKLAPADVQQTDDPDSQLIRAETCVFLVKLPRYYISTYIYCERGVGGKSNLNIYLPVSCGSQHLFNEREWSKGIIVIWPPGIPVIRSWGRDFFKFSQLPSTPSVDDKCIKKHNYQSVVFIQYTQWWQKFASVFWLHAFYMIMRKKPRFARVYLHFKLDKSIIRKIEYITGWYLVCQRIVGIITFKSWVLVTPDTLW